MLSLKEIYASNKFALSFELFPPKTDAGMADLMVNVEELVPFGPSYITCTYGAGGSTRDKTLDIVTNVKERFDVPVAAHLTCVGCTADDLRHFLREADARGVDFIMALRGDPPKGETTFTAVEGGYRYANELVAMIHAEFPKFGIAVAGYPETHQEACSPEEDLRNLKQKVDAGADVVITQLFYNNDDFYRWSDQCRDAGINVPIVPGILPVTNVQQIRRISVLCGAKLPDTFLARLEAHENDPQGQFDAGVYHATRQIEDLEKHGVPGLHLYCLNKSKAAASILRALALPSKTVYQR